MNETAYNLSAVYRNVGTLTDISALCRVEPASIMFEPITESDLENVKEAIRRRLTLRCSEGVKVDFQKDGKKILPFLIAFRNRKNDLWADDFAAGDWLIAKQVLRWFVECSEIEVKQKCVDFLNKQLGDEQWQYITDHGCGFLRGPAGKLSKMLNKRGASLRNYDHMYETTPEEKKALARTYNNVRADLPGHLTRFWLELFDQHGIEGAKDWIKSNWKPLNEETITQINAAYTAAKNKYTK